MKIKNERKKGTEKKMVAKQKGKKECETCEQVERRRSNYYREVDRDQLLRKKAKDDLPWQTLQGPGRGGMDMAVRLVIGHGRLLELDRMDRPSLWAT